jgi:hypothetical protein
MLNSDTAAQSAPKFAIDWLKEKKHSKNLIRRKQLHDFRLTPEQYVHTAVM